MESQRKYSCSSVILDIEINNEMTVGHRRGKGKGWQHSGKARTSLTSYVNATDI